MARIETIKCDRCGAQADAVENGTVKPRQVSVKVHRTGDNAVLDCNVDLCEGCFDSVASSCIVALEET
jgi:hypothetical protein